MCRLGQDPVKALRVEKGQIAQVGRIGQDPAKKITQAGIFSQKGCQGRTAVILLGPVPDVIDKQPALLGVNSLRRDRQRLAKRQMI